MKLSYIKIFYAIVSFCFLCIIPAKAQSLDVNSVFTVKDFQSLVLRNHPIVKQAFLLGESAQAKVMESLGKFDPLLETHFGRKQFGNKDYYSNWENALKVPLYIAGADLKVGYDRNYGDYTNPQYYTGKSGLGGIGLSVPIGQGLIVDERRNTLWQSQVMQKYAEADKVKQILTIWFNAVQEYWNWYTAYQKYQLMKDGVHLARVRYEAVVKQAELGDKAPVDSVEAFITVQDRQIQLTKLDVELNNARIILSNYLWNENTQPAELPDYAVPERVDSSFADMNDAQLKQLLDYAESQHPEILKLKAKSEQLDLDVAYQKEMMKPKLNVNAQLLTRRNTFGDYHPGYYDFRWENYKISLDFSFPLFMRGARGKIRQAQIKKMDNEYDLLRTNRTIQNDLFTSYNALTGYNKLLFQQKQNIGTQKVLVNAEVSKFDLGESTLFLINSRETKLIDMQMTQQDLIASYKKKIAEIYYKAGTQQE